MANPLYEKLEAQVSAAMDEMVTTSAFAELFTTSATNVMAATRLVNGAIDQAVRATRLAARDDVADLARQLARTEDKLERMLVLVEQLQQQVGELQAAVTGPPLASRAAHNGNGSAATVPAPAEAVADAVAVAVEPAAPVTRRPPRRRTAP